MTLTIKITNTHSELTAQVKQSGGHSVQIPPGADSDFTVHSHNELTVSEVEHGKEEQNTRRGQEYADREGKNVANTENAPENQRQGSHPVGATTTNDAAKTSGETHGQGQGTQPGTPGQQ